MTKSSFNYDSSCSCCCISRGGSYVGKVVTAKSSKCFIIVVLVKQFLYRVSSEKDCALLHGFIILIFPITVRISSIEVILILYK